MHALRPRDCAVLVALVIAVSWWVSSSSVGADDHGTVQPKQVGAQVIDPKPALLRYEIETDADDGTEVNDSVWYAYGYPGTELLRMGVAAGESYDLGLRFHVPDLKRGETFVYARLVLPATANGQVDSLASIRIVGVDQDDVAGFDEARPSQLPKTAATVAWELTENWPPTLMDFDCSPLRRYSPDISAIINEIVSRPEWGTGQTEKYLALVLEDDQSDATNFLTVEDYQPVRRLCPGHVCPQLELYRTVRSTFLGKELLGCPTDHSIRVNAYSLLDVEAYFEWGTSPGVYTRQTPIVSYPAAEPIEVVLDELSADRQYYYRLRYRRPGESVFAAAPSHSFHTQRPAHGTFTFAVLADSHLQNRLRNRDDAGLELYRRTLRNVHRDNPDFCIDLGDTFHTEAYVGRDSADYEEAIERHLDHRPYLELACQTAAYFVALGNHEGEQGWRLNGTEDSLAVWATNARKLLYPLPTPDDFYTGNPRSEPFVDMRENYYAWEWGDALFVVLDPFWTTTVKPHSFFGPGSGDNWDWTLGYQQYNWLVQTLENSSATFKFVFSHHVTGGVSLYGCGGVEAASHALGGRGSFEWGGEDLDGNYVFDAMRPGWGLPIHDLMVANDVTIYFHGHDHVFVRQELDGVVYQECPQPSDASYGHGQYVSSLYLSGDKVNNSGHVRVTVSPTKVTVEYVRAWLPGDGTNGEVAHAYDISAPASP